jgi:hypothetical protein
MRISKPSPAMVVAIIALVMATAGTGIAAKSLLINGSDIKNGTITADKLAPNAVVPKGWAAVTVPVNAHATSRNSKARLASVPKTDVEGTLCPDGTIVIDAPCPEPPPAQTGATGPAGSAGSTGSTGQPGASAGTSGTARFTVPEWNPILAVQYASPVGTGTTAETEPSRVATASASVLTELSNISLKMVKSGAKKPRSIEVFFWETTKTGGVFCELTPPSKESCTFPGPIVLEPGVTFALGIVTHGIVEPPNPPAGWEPYELSIGYTTNTIS